MVKMLLRVALIALCVAVLVLGYELYRISGIGQQLETKLADRCHRVDVAPGAEDIQYDSESGLVFITADNRRAIGAQDQSKGHETINDNGIYVLDVSVDKLSNLGKAVKVSPADWDDFRPHGLFLWNDGKGSKRLFVVNHKTNGDDNIEIFDVREGGTLTHVDSIAFPAMFSPNDVVAVGPRQFYATNDLVYHEGLGLYAEVLLSLPLTSVVYFDGEEGRTVTEGLSFANGINISPDGKTVYVAEWTDHEIGVFDRADNGDLTRRATWAMPTGVDNLDVEPDGTIWYGSLNRIFDFIKSIEDVEQTVDSYGVKVDPETGAHEIVFAAHAGEINSGSVAAVAGDKLLIGTVHDAHILVCPKPE